MKNYSREKIVKRIFVFLLAVCLLAGSVGTTALAADNSYDSAEEAAGAAEDSADADGSAAEDSAGDETASGSDSEEESGSETDDDSAGGENADADAADETASSGTDEADLGLSTADDEESTDDTESTNTVSFDGGDGSEEDPYQISTEEQFLDIKDDPDACYIITEDFTIESGTGASGISGGISFAGTLDGDGHTITHSSTALFSTVEEGGTVKNLTVDIDNDSGNYGAGITVYNYGLIEHCTATGSIYRSESTMSYLRIGGICSDNYGTISLCRSDVQIRLLGYGSGSTGIGLTYPNTWIGGIAGFSKGTVEYCYYSGLLQAYMSCGATSYVFNIYVGGVVGSSSNGSVTECAATGTIYLSYIDKSGYKAGAAVGYIMGSETKLNSSSYKYGTDCYVGEDCTAYLYYEVNAADLLECSTDRYIVLSTEDIEEWWEDLSDAYESAQESSGEEEDTPSGSFEGVCGDSLYWAFDYDTNTLTISGEGEMYDWDALTLEEVPWYEYIWFIKYIEIQDGASSIGRYAFNDCKYLEYVILPDTLTTIGDYAFSTNSDVFTDVYYAGTKDDWSGISISETGNDDLFAARLHYRADGLYGGICGDSMSWTYDTDTAVLTISGEGEMYDWAAVGDEDSDLETVPWCRLLDEIKYVVIEEGITSIGTCAFADAEALYYATMPGTLTAISARAFENCTSMYTVTIPEGVAEISDYTFSDCTALKFILIAESVTSIGEDAFYESENIYNVYYPSSEEQWNTIEGYDNEELANAEFYFNSSGERLICTKNSVSSCLKIGTSFSMYVGYYVVGILSDEVTEFIYAVSDSDVLEVTPGDWNSHYGQSFTITGTDAGSAVITFTDAESGWAESVSFTVNEEVSYSFSEVPVYNIEENGTDEDGNATYAETNFYNYSGMVVEGFSYEPNYDSDGNIKSYDVNMNIYNSTLIYGAVTVYDENGDFYDFCMIDRMKSSESSLSGVVAETIYSVHDLYCMIGNSLYYSGKSITKETEVSIEVPAGGYLEISNNASSPMVMLANVIGLTLNTSIAIADVDKVLTTDFETALVDSMLVEIVEKVVKGMVESSAKNLGDDEFLELINQFMKEESLSGDITFESAVTCFETITLWLADYGIDLIDTLLEKISSVMGAVTTAVSVTETVINASIPTGSITNFFFSLYKTEDMFLAWSEFCASFDYPTGIYLYTKSTDGNLYSNGIIVTPSSDTDLEKTVRSYIVSDAEAAKALPNISGSVYELYDITLYEDGAETQPDGTVTVKIPLSDTFAGLEESCIHVYRVGEDGTLTDMEAEIVDGYLVFTTDHFSYYALIYEPEILASGSCGDDLTWSLSSGGTLLIEGSGAMTNYSKASPAPWSDYEDEITVAVISDGVTSVGNYAFKGCSELSQVILADSIKAIGKAAFYGCSALSEITLPVRLTAIGWYAFYNCTSMEEITIPRNVTSIGTRAFAGCSALTVIYFMGDAPSFGSNVFCDVAAEIFYYYDEDNLTWTIYVMLDYGGDLTWTALDEDGNEVCVLIGSGSCGTDVTWTLTNTGVLTISGSGAMKNYSDDEYVPWYLARTDIKELVVEAGVTEIGDYAFYSCSDLAEAAIGEDVESIGDYAFYCCSSLTDITIGETAESIGERAFYKCTGLETLSIPADLTDLGDMAFYGCSGLADEDGLVVVNGYLFYCISDAESVVISADITNIGSSAFAGASVSNVYFEGDAPEYGTEIFKGLTATAYFYYDESNLTFTADLMASCGGTITWVALDENGSALDAFLTASGMCGDNVSYTLDNCGTFTLSGTGDMEDYSGYKYVPWYTYTSFILSLVVEEGVTSLGNYAFYGCSNLASLTLADSLESLGVRTFVGCSSLAEDGFIVVEGILFDYEGTETEITIPDNVTTIGYRAFMQDTIESVSIPEGVTTIEKQAFDQCLDMLSVALPEGLTDIGELAFDYCVALTELVIPSTVTSIGDKAFYNCYNVTEIYFEGDAPEIGENIFYNVEATAYYYYDEENITWTADLMESCGGTITWVALDADSNPVADAIIGIGDCGDDLTWELTLDGLFTVSGSGDMKNYSYSSGSSTAPWYEYRERITSLIIGEGVTGVGNYAFYRCSSMAEISLPDSLESINSYAFSYCTALTGISLPENVVSLGSSAFRSCTGIAEFILADELESIGATALGYCSALESIVIPAGVTSIGSTAFINCTSLTEIWFKGDPPSFGSNAFKNVTATAYFYYYTYDDTWTEDVLNDYGGTITWVALDGDGNETDVRIGHGSCGDDLTWILTSAGTLTISGSGDMTDYESCSSAPWYELRDSVKCVSISDEVMSIGDYAFYDCSSLTELDMPSELTDIGDQAFYGCLGLADEDGLIVVANIVFEYLGDAADVVISDGITEIGSYAFCGCGSLTGISIPDSVSKIGECAFYNCSALSSLAVSSDLTDIGDQAFYGCAALADSDGLVYVNTSLFYYAGSASAVEVPDDVTSIGSYAFYGCESLAQISLPSGLESIGDYAFYECTGLTAITLPASLTKIGTCAFGCCSALSEIYFEGGAPECGSDVFGGVTATAYYYDDESVTWTSEVFEICGGTITWVPLDEDGNEMDAAVIASGTCGDDLTWELTISGALRIEGTGDMDDYSYTNEPWYSYKSNIRTITFGEEVTSIGSYAFDECVNLESVAIPGNIITIGFAAFDYCDGLEQVIIEDGVEVIKGWAFTGCEELEHISIPDSVTEIGSFAFGGCSSLAGITLPYGLTEIASYMFNSCKALEWIAIPDTLTSISYYAFNNCSSLEDVYYYGTASDWKSVSSIDDTIDSAEIHYNSLGPEEIVDEEAEEKISESGTCGDDLTWTLTNTGVLTISGTGTMTGWSRDYAPWYESRRLVRKVVIEDGVTNIGAYAFENCIGLKSVSIPDSVTEIGANAFEYCTVLTGVELPDSVTSIGNYAFQYCIGLTGVTIPAGASSIGNYAFQYCTGLTEITLPDSVTEIGSYAFRNCSSLSVITFEGSAPEIGSCAFYGVTAAAYYDASDSSWTEDVMSDYGGSLTWTALEGSGSGSDSGGDSDGGTGGGSGDDSDGGTGDGSGDDSDSGTGDESGGGSDSGSDDDADDKTTIDISGAAVSLEYESTEYTGAAVEPAVTVKYGETSLTEGEDYTVSYTDNVNAGTATVTITGIGDYTGTAEKTFMINALSIKDASISLSATSYTYDGDDKKPSPTVALNNVELIKGTDYTVSYADNTNAGTATVTIAGAGNYTGTAETEFEIKAQELSSSNVSLSYTSKTYTGSAFSPTVTVKNSAGTTLEEETDYVVTTPSGRKNAGTYTYTITGTKNYTGAVKKTLTIKPVSIKTYCASCTLSTTSYTYSGSAKKPSVTLKVKVNGKTKTLSKVSSSSSSGYTVSYKNNTKIGKATVTITGTGNYTGTITKYFKIYPKKGTISSLKSSAKKKMTVKWKTISGSVTKYQVRYRVKGTSKWTTKTYSSSTKSKTITGLKSGKTYQVQVRAYKTVNGEKYCGSWSSTKTVKVK